MKDKKKSVRVTKKEYQEYIESLGMEASQISKMGKSLIKTRIRAEKDPNFKPMSDDGALAEMRFDRYGRNRYVSEGDSTGQIIIETPFDEDYLFTIGDEKTADLLLDVLNALRYYQSDSLVKELETIQKRITALTEAEGIAAQQMLDSLDEARSITFAKCYPELAHLLKDEG